LIKGEGKVEIVAWKTAERSIEMNANSPIILRIRTFYFPGWRAYIDDQETSLRKEDGTGAIIIEVPEGHHSLKLVFADTPVRCYPKIIALVSFLAVFVILISSNLGGRPLGK
jgi:uncharacterized membrane protein YfhO